MTKLSLCSITTPWRCLEEWRVHPRKTCLGTRRRQVASFRRRPLYPQGKKTASHCINGWMISRTNLDTVVQRKALSLPRIKPRTSRPPYLLTELSRYLLLHTGENNTACSFGSCEYRIRVGIKKRAIYLGTVTATSVKWLTTGLKAETGIVNFFSTINIWHPLHFLPNVYWTS